MKFKKADILSSLMFISLLIGAYIMLDGLKAFVYLWVLLFGGVTLVSLLLNKKTISTILFYLLIGLILLVTYLMLINLIIPMRDPNIIGAIAGKHDDKIYMDWRWGILFGFLLTFLTILLYHKSRQKNRVIEIAFAVLFIVIAFIRYIMESRGY
jgi:hypothetical protein